MLIVIRFAECCAIGAAAAHQRDVDSKFVLRPRSEGVAQVRGGVGKRSEDERFFIGLTELVRGGVFNFSLDPLLQLLQFCVTLFGYVFGRRMKQTELLLVALE